MDTITDLLSDIVANAHSLIFAGILIFWAWEIRRSYVARTLAKSASFARMDPVVSELLDTQGAALTPKSPAELNKLAIKMSYLHLMRSDPDMHTLEDLREEIRKIDQRVFDVMRDHEASIFMEENIREVMRLPSATNFDISALRARLIENFDELLKKYSHHDFDARDDRKRSLSGAQ